MWEASEWFSARCNWAHALLLHSSTQDICCICLLSEPHLQEQVWAHSASSVRPPSAVDITSGHTLSVRTQLSEHNSTLTEGRCLSVAKLCVCGVATTEENQICRQVETVINMRTKHKRLKKKRGSFSSLCLTDSWVYLLNLSTLWIISIK